MDELERLVREVIARPGDDGVRAVLADVLQAAGDPRGELISLQLLAARGDRDRDARIAELLRAHAGSWLGALRDHTVACCFDRGFVSRLALAVYWSTDDARWPSLLAEPALATVEDLVATPAPAYARFVASPTLHNLRRVLVRERVMLAALATSPARIEHVVFDASSTDSAPLAEILSVCARRRSLTSLAIAAEYVAAVVQRPWFRERIRALTIVGPVRRALALWPRLGCDLAVVPHADLEPCEPTFPWDYKVEVWREDGRAAARISGEWLLHPIAALEALPPEVTRIEIELASDVIATRVRELIARPGVEVVVRPPRTTNFVWAR